MFSVPIIGAGILAVLAIIAFAIVISMRRVVSTNEVHIIQTRKHTISYGKGMDAGNTYYQWPSWVPILGLTRIILPVSVFDVKLIAYEAYDKDRVPFNVDVVAFFRINDSNTAAQRVSSFEELHNQLTSVVQGTVRTVLASHDINEIMVERSKFGEQFTREVQEQLKQWGVETVKNIELMDIRDSKDSVVIHNIMSKKTSEIERDSRVAVAANKQAGKVAEIDAQQQVDVRAQAAQQQVGLREAERVQVVGIANERAEQEIKAQQKETANREQDVVRVNEVREAEIERDVQVVRADQTKQTSIIQAEGTKQQTILTAEGNLESTKRESEGIRVQGEAKAAAETALQLAPVTAQVTLAKEIGENQGYQHYLISLKQIDAAQAIGTAQASALSNADVKVIASSGTPSDGLTSVMDTFSAKGGTQIAAMLEALVQSPTGAALLAKVTAPSVVESDTALD